MGANIHVFIEWLGQTSLSQTIQIIPWIIPSIQTIHILAIAAVIGSMSMLDLRVLGIANRSQSLSSVSTRLLPWVWTALIILLLTGLVLVIGEPGRSLANPVFQIKMILVLTVAILTYFLQGKLRKANGDGAAMSAKLIALVSLFVWVAIVFAGRWIAYGDTLFGNSGAQ